MRFFGEVVVIVIVIVTGQKQSQLLVFWTWLGLEFDKNNVVPAMSDLTKQAGLSRATLEISSEFSSNFPLRTIHRLVEIFHF